MPNVPSIFLSLWTVGPATCQVRGAFRAFVRQARAYATSCVSASALLPLISSRLARRTNSSRAHTALTTRTSHASSCAFRVPRAKPVATTNGVRGRSQGCSGTACLTVSAKLRYARQSCLPGRVYRVPRPHELLHSSHKTGYRKREGLPAHRNGLPVIRDKLPAHRNGVPAIRNVLPARRNGVPIIRDEPLPMSILCARES